MINQVNCKNCAAPLNLSLNKCEYCLTPLNVSDLTIHSLTKKDYKIHSALEVLRNSQNAYVPSNEFIAWLAKNPSLLRFSFDALMLARKR